MSAKDIRASLLKHNPFKSRIVEISVPGEPLKDGSPGTPEVLKVKVKQPSVEERQAIFAEAKVGRDGAVSASSSKTAALAIIYCARDPDTDEPVFTAADIDTIMQSPAGGWVDLLSQKVMELLSEAAESAKK